MSEKKRWIVIASTILLSGTATGVLAADGAVIQNHDNQHYYLSVPDRVEIPSIYEHFLAEQPDRPDTAITPPRY
ncbi:hypothetical protein SK355_08355 [Candidatus Fukatsuia symbiotica]|uniref:Uncharacterized protein n=1 Tax=Candidatus Fukatsuia symbiotica TaxID=1878942 RepID=A0A2U8I6V8_9GAMM|nr:hypothetical protein [Candidatus Fukatsuia symbiotica]AWK14906.1 hypothetical protein CCS41_11140 [Candidatus Fukatsuia symbiotica]MEA9445255.1 hypothetical protein [Candidatus Fukatsuia symbiotica]